MGFSVHSYAKVFFDISASSPRELTSDEGVGGGRRAMELLAVQNSWGAVLAQSGPAHAHPGFYFTMEGTWEKED
jgi:hypothetical protein